MYIMVSGVCLTCTTNWTSNWTWMTLNEISSPKRWLMPVECCKCQLWCKKGEKRKKKKIRSVLDETQTGHILFFSQHPWHHTTVISYPHQYRFSAKLHNLVLSIVKTRLLWLYRMITCHPTKSDVWYSHCQVLHQFLNSDLHISNEVIRQAFHLRQSLLDIISVDNNPIIIIYLFWVKTFLSFRQS